MRSPIPPVDTVTENHSAPKVVANRRRVRFDVSIESAEDSNTHWIDENEVKDLWYSKQEIRDMRRNLVALDTQKAFTVIPPIDWWRFHKFFCRFSCLRNDKTSRLTAERKFVSSIEDVTASADRNTNNNVREYQRKMIQMRARLAVAYIQEAEIIGLERILAQYYEDCCLLLNNAGANQAPPNVRDSILKFLHREKNADKVAAFQQHISRPSCLFAREIAVAQACAVKLSA